METPPADVSYTYENGEEEIGTVRERFLSESFYGYAKSSVLNLSVIPHPPYKATDTEPIISGLLKMNRIDEFCKGKREGEYH